MMRPTLLQSLLNQPSRSYSADQPQFSESPTEETPSVDLPAPGPSPAGDGRVVRRNTNYYSSVADPRLRKEWEQILHPQKQRSLPRRPVPPRSKLGPVPGSSRRLVSLPASLPEEVPKESDEDVFYTPQTSPKSSPKPHLAAGEDIPDDASVVSTAYRASSITSGSSRSTDAPTNYSWSDQQSQETMTTISASSSKGKRVAAPVVPSGVIQQQWDKDVRWLVPHGGSSTMVAPAPAPARSNSSSSSRRRGARPRVKRRMSAVMERDEDDASQASSPSTSRTRSPGGRSRSASRPTAASSLLFPTPLQVTNGVPTSSTGYTTLLLPRAAYTPSKHPDRVSSRIDITRSGLAQTTMAAISISKHGAEAAVSRRDSLRRTLARSISRVASSSTPNIAKTLEATPAHLLANLPTPLSFTSHMPPPSKLQPDQVLVQVFAVALDKLDLMLVREKSKKVQGYGFVPGRSFVGRVVEFGWEVPHITRGEWVFGLMEVRESGALSEFVVVDRRRLAHCPTPGPTLSLEQLATLPLNGVPAQRTMRTLIGAGLDRSNSENTDASSDQPRVKRALVLGASDGVGALVTQQLCMKGVRVTAHVQHTDEGDAKDDSNKVTVKTRMALYGAKEVKMGDPLDVLATLPTDGFDMVVDNIGGRQIWESAKRILSPGGQFTTVVGDTHEDATSRTAHFRSNLRSLTSAFVKQDVSSNTDTQGSGSSKNKKKSIGYEWISPAEELEDTRDALATIGKLASSGMLVPWFTKEVQFESIPSEFGASAGGRCLAQGGTIVTRVASS